MSDDDLIRRGDALAIVTRDRVPTNTSRSEFRVVSTQERRDAIAALPTVTVGVRALEWEAGMVHWAKPLPGMKYVACSQEDGRWSWWLDGDGRSYELCASEDAAKAAAQRDYEARIFAALEPTDPPEEIGILRARVESLLADNAALRRELAMGRAAPTDAAQAPTDTRPANCRFRLKDEGKPYGRSSCSACGKSVFTGLGNSCTKGTTDAAQAHEYCPSRDPNDMGDCIYCGNSRLAHEPLAATAIDGGKSPDPVVNAPDPVHRPTMTDMMVDPDTLDAFMEANPLPDDLVPTDAPQARVIRNGEHLFNTAKALGWADDGEGALEFVMRRTREVALEDAAQARPAWLSNCVMCGRIVDTREKSEGGDGHGCEYPEGWTCSSECAEKLHPDPEWMKEGLAAQAREAAFLGVCECGMTGPCMWDQCKHPLTREART